MKKFQIKTGLVFASWALVLIFGCHKKKPNIPPEQTPPTIISQIPIEPLELPAGQGTQEQNPPAQDQQAENTKPPAKPAPPKHTKHTPPKRVVIAEDAEKPAATEIAKNTQPPVPPRIVIQESNTNNSASSAGSGTGKDDASNSQSTQQLIDGAENNLRKLKRDLSSDEKSMVAQIREYITGSKQATKEGDHVRAHMLANKAHQLSDELVKAR